MIECFFKLIKDVTFCEAHWLFAIRYLRVSYEMPLILKQKTLEKRQILCYDVTKYVFVFLNFAIPLGFCYFYWKVYARDAQPL